MAQLFSKRSDVLVRSGIIAAILLVMGAGGLIHALWWSPYLTRVDQRIEQPIPFSHRHHAGALGIDCRYCHTSVESAASAGMPATETCMSCHSHVWRDAPVLAPVRESARTGEPILWNRVYDLPEFTYFHHGIHVQSGIDCSACHGEVRQMALTYRARPLYMKTCLECHRDPAAPGLLPATNSTCPSAASDPPEPDRPSDAYRARAHQLSDCTICHR